MTKRVTAEDITAAVTQIETGEVEVSPLAPPLSVSTVVSTGCTLLDLAISGSRVRGGGLPGGILVEVFGPPGSGKTAVLVETAANVQAKGGRVSFADPEARLDREYSALYGMELTKDSYMMPDTVEELFDFIHKLKVDPEIINLTCADSLAALSTEMEMAEQDKMGMRRAKVFSERLRKSCRLLAAENRLLLCSNQVRQGDVGEVTPGGNAVPFYASVRVRLQKVESIKLERDYKNALTGEVGAKIERTIGIKTKFSVVKNSVDDPFRDGYFYLMFGYGIDDIRTNLQYVKDITKDSRYQAVDKAYVQLNAACEYIEQNNLQHKLRENVIDVWEDVTRMLRVKRKPKERM